MMMLHKINNTDQVFFLFGDDIPFFCHTIFEFGKNANSIKWYGVKT